MQADGRILVAGRFTSIGGQPRNLLARLDPTTGLADSFNPDASGAAISAVVSTVVQADGQILAAGIFTNIGGQPRNRIARLDPTSGLADSFNPNANNNVFSISVQADGKIVASGSFTNIGGQMRNRIARLDSQTGLADSFNPDADGSVSSIAIQADGKILAGGPFTNIGGQPRGLFARLNNDTSAMQNLAVTQTTVSWTLGGSSPQFARVTFEDSTDGVNYNFLGNGTASGGAWSLTGLNLSTAQNIYIRARGFYRGGYQSDSESIVESVRNAFLPPPPTPTQIVSRKGHGGTGTFDVVLPLTGNPGIECRAGGTGGNHQVVVTFASPVSVGVVSVASSDGLAAATQGVSGTEVTINLSTVANAQTLGITLVGVSDGTGAGNVVVPMGVLLGDSNGNGVVNSGDAVQTRGRAGQATDNLNFRSDVNADGFVNSGDTTLVRARSGTSLP